jgi:hypothetical protein
MLATGSSSESVPSSSVEQSWTPTVFDAKQSIQNGLGVLAGAGPGRRAGDHHFLAETALL